MLYIYNVYKVVKSFESGYDLKLRMGVFLLKAHYAIKGEMNSNDDISVQSLVNEPCQFK